MTKEGFELTLVINGASVTFTADDTEESIRLGWTRFFFTPKELESSGSGLCEVCRAENVKTYLIEGHVKELCEAHAGDGAISLDVMPTLVPTGLAISPSEVDLEKDARRKTHSLMMQLEAGGLTRKQISEELTRQGYEEVSERTVGKHLRDECSCFPENNA